MTTIGVFDSGVGGLSVLRELRSQLPCARLLYFADTAHVPYGPRPLAEVRDFSFAIADFLLVQGAQALVVACNTASAAALHPLRARLPAPVVGMEPAVKPAVEHSHTGVVAVLATQATFQGALFASVVERFAHGVEVIPQVCPGLVEQIEAGELAAPRTEEMLRGWIEPLLGRGIDALVLGCTHYPFVRPLIEQICGPGGAGDRPLRRRWRGRRCACSGALDDHPAGPATGPRGEAVYYTTGSVAHFAQSVAEIGRPARRGAGGGLGRAQRSLTLPALMVGAVCSALGFRHDGRSGRLRFRL
jgi:glutamate racemase